MADLRTVLCAEDDDNYALLLRNAFKQAGLNHNLFHVSNGAKAIEYLKGEGKFADRSTYPIPCVVLADLKMPVINGFELLAWIRQQSPYPHIPVVVLTLSEEYRDIHKAYAIGANSFLVKPPNVEDLKEIVKMLDSYWLKLNRLEEQANSLPSGIRWIAPAVLGTEN